MDELNPYESPAEVSSSDSLPEQPDPASPATVAIDIPVAKPAISTTNTLLRRYLAVNFDMVLSLALSLASAKFLLPGYPWVQLVVLVVVFLGYFLLSEGLFARTPGKLLAGLVVVQFNGDPCTFRQTLIRTAFRLLEVNPALLGGAPAGLAVVATKHHQRFGDQKAGTIVVSSARWRKWRAARAGR